MDFSIAKIAPEVILAVGGMFVLVVGLLVRARMSCERVGVFSPEAWSIFVMLSALGSSIWLMVQIAARKSAGSWQFGGVFAVDGLAVFFKIIALVSTLIVALISIDYFRKVRFHRGEYYALLVFAALAITCLAGSTDLIMIYLSLEFLSLTSYVLAGYLKNDPRSSEAAVKYFLYGSIAAAVMIYGMSMLYGLTGTTNLVAIARYLETEVAFNEPVVMLSAVMILAGFGFKIAMVPFHQWAPDTYEGAPTPVTAFLSVGSKAAGFAVLMRVLATGLVSAALDWILLVIILSGVTMTFGNLVAIPQTNIKRLLAYSSIAQAGYLLMGIAAMTYSEHAVPSVLIYLLIYLFMNLGAFAVAVYVSARLGTDELEDFAGLIRRAPFAASAMALFLLSLAGIPPTAGFVGKLYLFLAVFNAAFHVSPDVQYSPLFWLAVLGVANTVVSVYYYMNVARLMFFVRGKEETPISATRPLYFVVGLAVAATILILVYPQPFIALAYASAKMLSRM